jgi:hypothetical protein
LLLTLILKQVQAVQQPHKIGVGVGIGPHQLGTGARLTLPVAADIVKKHPRGPGPGADVWIGHHDRCDSVILVFLLPMHLVFGRGFQRKAQKDSQHRDPKRLREPSRSGTRVLAATIAINHRRPFNAVTRSFEEAQTILHSA